MAMQGQHARTLLAYRMHFILNARAYRWAKHGTKAYMEGAACLVLVRLFG